MVNTYFAVPSSPPTSLYATVSTVRIGEVYLQWSAPQDAAGGTVYGYKVEQSSNLGVSWTTLTANGGWSGTSYYVSGLTSGTTWQFRVSALTSSGGVSMPSNVAVAIIYTASDAPLNLTGNPTDGQVQLNWATPSNTGGSAIYGYGIDYVQGDVRDPLSGSWTSITPNTGSTITSYNVVGLQSGTLYSFRVRALTSFGPGRGAIAQTIPQRQSQPPMRLRIASQPTDDSIALNWSAPQNNATTLGFFAGSISGYSIEQQIGSTWTPLAQVIEQNFLNYTVSGLTPGTLYNFRVAAITTGGSGTLAGLTAQTPIIGQYAYLSATPMGRPGSVQSFQAVAGKNAGDAVISWAPPILNGGQSIIGYELNYSTNSGGSWSMLSPLVTGTTFTVSGLTTGIYYYRVVPITQYAKTFDSNTWNWVTTTIGVTGTTASTTVTPAVTNLVALMSDAGQSYAQDTVNLYWGAPAVASGVTLSGYSVEKSINGGTSWTTITNNISSPPYPYVVTGLNAGLNTSFRVIALTSAGPSLPAVTSIRPGGVSTAVQNLSATFSFAQATLTWSNPLNTGGYPIIGYRIEQTQTAGCASGFTTLTNNTGTAINTYTVNGLENGVVYCFRVTPITSLPGSANWADAGLGTSNTVLVTPYSTPDWFLRGSSIGVSMSS